MSFPFFLAIFSSAMLPFSHGTWRPVGLDEIARGVSMQEGRALRMNEKQTFRWWNEMGSVEHFHLQLNIHTTTCPNP